MHLFHWIVFNLLGLVGSFAFLAYLIFYGVVFLKILSKLQTIFKNNHIWVSLFVLVVGRVIRFTDYPRSNKATEQISWTYFEKILNTFPRISPQWAILGWGILTFATQLKYCVQKNKAKWKNESWAIHSHYSRLMGKSYRPGPMSSSSSTFCTGLKMQLVFWRWTWSGNLRWKLTKKLWQGSKNLPRPRTLWPWQVQSGERPGGG